MYYLASMATPRIGRTHTSTGLPLKEQLDKPGPDPIDWEQVVPILLDAIASGLPAVRAMRENNIPHCGDTWRQLSSDRWRQEYGEARRAGALARVDQSHDRLLTLAEDTSGTVRREHIDAARWEAEHGKWMAERSDPESWGREDRVKIASVSAIRVIVETPPQAAQLPSLPMVTEIPATQAPRLIGDGA
jgi:hypothetical protein